MPRLDLRKGKRAASFDCQLGGVVAGGEVLGVDSPTRGLEGSAAAIVVYTVVLVVEGGWFVDH